MGGSGRERIDDDEVIRRDTSEFDRGLSFFDAIYGFAVTLLIVNVDLPEPQAWQDLGSLAASGVGQQLLGVALSFVVICALWRVNVRMIKGLTGLDGPMVFGNLLATGLVILVPFTTDAISNPATADLALPTALYAVNIAGVALAQAAVYQRGRAAGLERRPTSARENSLVLLAATTTPAVFLASVPVALTVGAAAAQFMWVSLIVLLPLTGRLANRARGT
ncbi:MULTISPECIES: TMEM175 family protein [unclassified Dietzia]|uniref:TMEM175 family protein n=1 Tax=unclassified Dietzia TaxID=2617939 RepID=UPI001E2B9B06|nr:MULTISPECIES: TMEM175 family protein [unclassified Dietzia]